MYRTIAICTASVNPDKAQAALRRLIEEMFPEVAKEREDAVEKAMQIMEQEKDKTYSVQLVGQGMNKGPMGRLRSILKQKRVSRRA